MRDRQLTYVEIEEVETSAAWRRKDRLADPPPKPQRQRFASIYVIHQDQRQRRTQPLIV